MMLRTVANANLTFEELSNVLVEIKAILNSQPIATLSEDPNDGEVLTPDHLLIRSALKTIHEKIAESPVVNYLKRYQLIILVKVPARSNTWTAARGQMVNTSAQYPSWRYQYKGTRG